MAKLNREIKAGVFADLFGDDEKDGKKNFLSLYNAIQNMPLRCLEYYVHLLNTIIPSEARYKDALYKIPTPEFYVFYNGNKKVENECIMKLSDAFLEKQEEPLCEVKVKFTNIRGENDEILPVVQKCDILKQYCKFMEIVSRYKAELKEQPTDEEMRICIDKAISEAISRNILADYLTRNGTEVRNMLQAEYDYDLDMQVKAQEAREEKAIEIAKKMLTDKKLTVEEISLYSGLPLEQVLELQKQIPVKA